ncbi:MAG: hypothetical protein AAF705_13305 [Bacteroidota bacterium]
MKQLIIIFLVMCIVPALFGQAPQSFNYQGVARDLSGIPIPDKMIGLRISILEESITGREVYQETHQVTTSEIGLFSLKIGAGNTSNGTFQQIGWGENEYFLKIEMDESGGTNYQLIGASQLLSVPYALHAGNGSLWKENNEGIHFDTGNVGIGIDEPRYPLEIGTEQVSHLYFRNNQNSQNNGTQLLLGHSQNGFAGIYFDSKDGDFIGGDYSLIKRINNEKLEINNLDPVPIEFFTNNSLRLKIDGLGNVGVGTQRPQSRLHISSGDIYIEDVTSGVIMKAPNGNCWRMTVTNDGQPEFREITCPN